MRDELISEVVQRMLPHLDNKQLVNLQNNLNQVLQRYDVELINGGNSENDNQELVEKYISAKRVEGRSEKTLNYYLATIEAMNSSEATTNTTIFVGNIHITNRRSNTHKSVISLGHSFRFSRTESSGWKTEAEFCTTLEEDSTNSIFVICIAFWRLAHCNLCYIRQYTWCPSVISIIDDHFGIKSKCLLL